MGKFSDFIRADMARRGLNQSEWARFCGISQQVMHSWLGGGLPNVSNSALVKVSEATDTPLESLLAMRESDAVAKGKKPMAGDIPPSAQEAVARMNGPLYLGQSKDLPLRGLVAGGSMNRVVFSNSDEDTYEYIERPATLIGIPDGYAVEVCETSMESRYMHNRDILHVNPRRPPRAGDFVVLHVKDKATGEIVGFVKQLVSMDKQQVVTKQLNPPKTIKFKAADVKAVHSIVGTAEK